MARMTRRAARRRRWRIAIGLIVVTGLFAAWWVYAHRQPPTMPTQTESSVVPAPATTVPVAPPPMPSTAQAPAAAQIAALDAAQAREEKWAEDRRESIRVQQRLRKDAAAERARVNAQETNDTVRCIDGHKMKRVSNGWVDDGTC